MTLTIGAGITGVFQDASNTTTVEAGDELDYQTVSGGTGTIVFALMSVLFDATTNCVSRLIAQGYSSVVSGTTHYLYVAGNRSGATTAEANVENTIKVAGYCSQHVSFYFSQHKDDGHHIHT